LGDLLVVDVVEVGVVPHGRLGSGRLGLDGWASLRGPKLVLLLGDGMLDLGDPDEDCGIGGEEVASGLLGGFEGSGLAAESV
jgi:hypothetical protein